MAVNGVYSYSGYSSLNNYDYDSWVEKANSAASSVSSTTSASSTSSSKKTSTSSVDTSSSSVFLMNYQMKLSDLEIASSKLQTSKDNNVFSKYESAVEKFAQATTDEERDKALVAVDKAKEDIISASKDFAEKYNAAISFLQNNSSRSTTVSSQLSSMQWSIPTDKAMKTYGFRVDEYGKLSVDEDKMNEMLDESYDFVKEELGGQFGIAERVGSKATAVLDSSVDSILGTSSKTADAESTDSTSSSTKSSSSSSSSKAYSMPDGLTSFYNFARAGAFNLSNYYAVGMLLNTTG